MAEGPVEEERDLTRGGLVAGLAIVALLVSLDIAWGSDRVLTTTVVLGPFVASLVSTVRQTLIVAAVAVLVALLSPLWNDATFTHFVRQVVLLTGSGVSVVAAQRRARVLAARGRLALLVALGETTSAQRPLEATARQVVELLVPEVAQACTIDAVRDGRPERLAGTDGATSVEMPLRSRGLQVGLIAFGGVGRGDGRRVEENDRYLRAIADRVGLVLDNAGLSSELAEAERRLGVALDAMAGAVLIQRPGEGIVYANQAAADALGLPDPAAVMAATPEEIAGEWDSTLEDGTPLTPDRYPSRQILTGTNLHPAPLVARGLHRTTGREMWSVVRATAVLDEDGAVIMAVSITEDITAIKRAELVQRLLADAGAALSSSLHVDALLQAFAEVLAERYVEWVMINLPAPAGGVRLTAVANADPELVEATWEHDRQNPARVEDPLGAPRILRGEGPMLIAPADTEHAEKVLPPERVAWLREIGLRSVLHVAIAPPTGPPLGALTLANRETGRALSEEDVSLAQELGRRAGVALQTALLYDERSRIAATLQDSLLPERLPPVEGFALAVAYRPAAQNAWIGGDFYDVFRTPGGWMVVVGDVAGQGAEAAALTAQARHTLRSAGTLTGDPVRALTHLNEMLVARTQLSLCTACAVLLPGVDAGAGGVARIVCGGHPLPLRVRDGAAEEVGTWGVLIGAYADATFTAIDVELLEDDLLVMYTDGVIDSRAGEGRFGDARLRDTVRDASTPEDAVTRVEQALDAFQTGTQADDTAVLVVGRAPAGGLSPPERQASPAAPPAR